MAFTTTEQMDGDTNADVDVYLRDLAAGTTQLVSRRGPAGPVGNDESSQPAVDFDGTHVAFHSAADDLDPPVTDANGFDDVFLRDVTAGQTSTVSRAVVGVATGSGSSGFPSISDDGGRVAYASTSPNLVSGAQDVNAGLTDIFVRDVAGATTLLASRTAGAGGVSGNGGSERASIDGSGTRVAFESLATDLVGGDANGWFDVLVRDLEANTIERATRANGPAGAQSVTGGQTPSLSGDGDCIAFETRGDELVAMPPGTDFLRVVARSLRGDCPFRPVGPGRSSLRRLRRRPPPTPSRPRWATCG